MNITIKKAGQRVLDTKDFVLSTEAPDRHGDIVKAEGWKLTEFRKNPVALWQHDHNSPIGVWENLRIERGALVGSLKLAAAGTSRLVDVVRSLVDQGIVRAVSVGFRALKSEPRDKTSYARIFHEAELLEASLVSVPANSQALAIAKSMQLTDTELNLFFDSASSGGRAASGDPDETIQRAKHAIIAAKRAVFHR